jgi:hypothetical protein
MSKAVAAQNEHMPSRLAGLQSKSSHPSPDPLLWPFLREKRGRMSRWSSFEWIFFRASHSRPSIRFRPYIHCLDKMNSMDDKTKEELLTVFLDQIDVLKQENAGTSARDLICDWYRFAI